MPHYEVVAKKSRYHCGYPAAAAKADEILIATDPDREGEAIAWHSLAGIIDAGVEAPDTSFGGLPGEPSGRELGLETGNRVKSSEEQFQKKNKTHHVS